MSTELIFHIEWIDSAIRQGWLDRDEAIAQGVVTVHSVGFLLVQDDDRIVLAGSVHEDGEVAGVVVIPRSAIRGTVMSWTGE